MVFYPRYGLILFNIQRNWFEISSNPQKIYQDFLKVLDLTSFSQNNIANND